MGKDRLGESCVREAYEPRKYREGGYLRKLPADPWGSPFVYRRPGDHGEYDLFSLGADGEEGGDGPGKDITNWE